MIILLCSPTTENGKDSVAKIITENSYTFRVGIADEGKKFAKQLGYDDSLKSKDIKHRRLIIDLLNAARRFDGDTWIRRASKDINMYIGFEQNVVVSDLRFLAEYNYIIRNYSDVVTIGVESSVYGNTQLINDESQREYSIIPKDIIITNDGTLEELKERVLSIMKGIKII